MGLKNGLISLALCATTSLMAFQSNSEKFINYTQKNVEQISASAQQKQPLQINKLVEEMLANSKVFNLNVMLYSDKYIYNWVREDSGKIAEYLATLTSHIDDKKDFFKQLTKRSKDFNLNKNCRNNIKEIVALLDAMRKQIQTYINFTYKGMDAKHSFNGLQAVLKIDNKITLDDYWYSYDLTDKVLFLTSKCVSEKSVEEVFTIEDQLTEELNKLSDLKSKMTNVNLPKIAGFSFDSLNQQHFNRVSFI